MNDVVINTASLIASFSFGVLLGRYTERHQELTMDLATRTRLLYDRWAPAFVVVVALLAVAGIWIGTTATIVNGRQDDERAAEETRRNIELRALLECFDDYAAAQSTASGAVREALVRVDAATSVRDDTLNREGVAFKQVVQGILRDTLDRDDLDRLRQTLEDREKASRTLDVAQDALDAARRDNPVPDPPSEFCSVKP